MDFSTIARLVMLTVFCLCMFHYEKKKACFLLFDGHISGCITGRKKKPLSYNKEHVHVHHAIRFMCKKRNCQAVNGQKKK